MHRPYRPVRLRPKPWNKSQHNSKKSTRKETKYKKDIKDKMAEKRERGKTGETYSNSLQGIDALGNTANSAIIRTEY